MDFSILLILCHQKDVILMIFVIIAQNFHIYFLHVKKKEESEKYNLSPRSDFLSDSYIFKKLLMFFVLLHYKFNLGNIAYLCITILNLFPAHRSFKFSLCLNV